MSKKDPENKRPKISIKNIRSKNRNKSIQPKKVEKPAISISQRKSNLGEIPRRQFGSKRKKNKSNRRTNPLLLIAAGAAIPLVCLGFFWFFNKGSVDSQQLTTSDKTTTASVTTSPYLPTPASDEYPIQETDEALNFDSSYSEINKDIELAKKRIANVKGPDGKIIYAYPPMKFNKYRRLLKKQPNTDEQKYLLNEINNILKTYYSSGLKRSEYKSITHKVQAGENVNSIADLYQVDPEVIFKYNASDTDRNDPYNKPKPGDKLIIYQKR